MLKVQICQCHACSPYIVDSMENWKNILLALENYYLIQQRSCLSLWLNEWSSNMSFLFYFY